MTLDPAQVKTALAGLPGWQYEDGALVRGVSVTDDSRDGLIEALAHLSSDDVELAARIDPVLSGSASDQGSGRS
jgi:pterin-4a-carbinolamine dehydratase